MANDDAAGAAVTVADDITEFMVRPDGTRMRQFSVDGISVQVFASDVVCEGRACELVSALHAHARGVVHGWRALEERCALAEQRATRAEAEAVLLATLVPPAVPTRMLGPGCVRFRGDQLWLLNRRETGWSSWGVRLDGWDDLFRRYAVAITEHGTDEYGAYWIAVPQGRINP